MRRDLATLKVVSADLRTAFLARLEERLAQKGISLLASELGREEDLPVWLLTLELPNKHVLSVRARVAEGAPLSLEVAEDIAARVIKHAL
jgi:hypothetical protein